MKTVFTRILVWLGIMAMLTLIAMGAWFIVSGGSQTTASLKWFQFVQTAGTFLVPPILCAWLWDSGHRPTAWLKLDKGADLRLFAIAIGIMICAIPAINLTADLNGRIVLPESLGFIEQKMRAMEEAAAVLTERFLQADSLSGLLINIGLMALLPAMAEELSFRGTLQQVLQGEQQGYRMHAAIWITAIIFSAIHMQFYGFIPRMLMDAMFGYLFVWSGSLWIPIAMHFTNNSLAVTVYYLTADSQEASGKTSADTIGAGDTWWIGVTSLGITCLGLLIFYRKTHTR